MTAAPLHTHHWSATGSTSTPWICLHGFLGSGADFEILIDHWENHPDIQAPDLPGFGKSPVSPSLPNTQNLCASLSPLIDNCPAPPILLGYSMGARLALQCALTKPSRLSGLVLIGGTPGIEADAEREARCKSDAQWIQLLQSNGIDAFLKQWNQQGVIQSQANIAEAYYQPMKERRRKLAPDTLCNYLHAFGTGTMPSAWHRLSELKLPTLLLTGEHDAKFTNIAKSMTSQLPLVSHQVVPDCGHAALFENPQATIKALNGFLPNRDDHL